MPGRRRLLPLAVLLGAGLAGCAPDPPDTLQRLLDLEEQVKEKSEDLRRAKSDLLDAEREIRELEDELDAMADRASPREGTKEPDVDALAKRIARELQESGVRQVQAPPAPPPPPTAGSGPPARETSGSQRILWPEEQQGRAQAGRQRATEPVPRKPAASPPRSGEPAKPAKAAKEKEDGTIRLLWEEERRPSPPRSGGQSSHAPPSATERGMLSHDPLANEETPA